MNFERKAAPQPPNSTYMRDVAQVLLDMLNVQVVAAPVVAIDKNRSTMPGALRVYLKEPS